MPLNGHDSPLLRGVPLFPLPNVVLFPRAVLPLHIFEPRYREMVNHALDGPGQIAMALLKDAYGQTPDCPSSIHDIVCVGQIIAHERMDDGRINLLLQGQTRARIVDEDRSMSYRRADLRPVACPQVFEIDLHAQREQMVAILNQSDLNQTSLASQLARMLEGPLSTADAADIFAFHLIDDIDLKQELLATTDVNARVKRVVGVLREAHPPIASYRHEYGHADLN